jgi:NAD(P)-dependent dehydrogenase (short-subunit alcohol dehydrogenase family)
MPNDKESRGLSGLVAAITGGAGELCGGMSDALGDLGVKVAVLDVDQDRAVAKAQMIKSRGGQALGLGVDVLKREDLTAAADAILREWGGLNILINGAGGNHPQATTSDTQSFFNLPIEAMRKVFELNCLGTILPCQVLGELIVKTVRQSDGWGHIINISSMNALRPLTRIPAYSAAKAAVSNFTQWLAVHMAQNYTPKVRVNAIAPGFFLTAQNRFLLVDQESGEFTPRGKTILAHTPAGELGKAEDLVSTLLWLLDPRSRLVTGIVVPVDGGFSAFSGV